MAKPPGFEMVSTAKHTKSKSIASTIETKKNEDITQVKTIQHDQDITPSIENRQFERVDDEGQRYLNYKSISGMDNLPRYRQPTPPKIVSPEEEDLDGDKECDKCCRFRDRCKDLVNEN